MFNSLLEGFPDKYTPNSQQLKLLKNIDQAFEDGYKFVVCAAPTGSGKSFISKTLGNVSDSPPESYIDLIMSYLAYKRSQTGGYMYEEECEEQNPFGAFELTITKSLQDQYKELFPDVTVLKGKSNYQCEVDRNLTVENGPCLHSSKLKEECWAKNRCPYYEARNKALVSTFSTLNYNMFFALPKHLKRRKYLICDEASELEDQIVKEFSIKLNFDFLKKCEITINPFPQSDYGKVGRWLSHISVSINDRMEDLKSIVSNGKHTSPIFLADKRAELLSLKNIHNKITAITSTWSDSEYLYEREATGISFTPLKVNNLANYLFENGEKIVLMSATIIDPVNFCKTLGITKFKYIEADSTFDSTKAPIYVQTKIKLNHSNLQKNLSKIAKQVQDICNLHSQDKGIIHTHSNYITEYLKNNISSNNRILFREPGVNNEHLIAQHTVSAEPTVLASPSMSHGIDLKDDLARFQIIIKAPYLPLVDKRVERMMKIDFSWYLNKMLSSLIQSCGRGVRSHKDHCVTYILDGAVIEQVIKNKHKLPKYFIDRFV
jgi:ATP-dependent DNA helicase DinG